MILLYVLVIVVLINCLYYVLFANFSFLASSENLSKKTYPVSVIVCAKNEAENLAENIPHLLSQEHPDFEIILINDRSTDETFEVMERFAEKDNRVKLVNVAENEAFWGNKKYALTLGIKKAVNHRLLFTDADCKPSSDQWIQKMTQQLDGEKELTLGYGTYQKRPGLLNTLIRFETAITAIQYFAYNHIGLPYMGVGRNMAYTSQLFYANKGFMSHIKLPSGDDDLFVNESATKNNAVNCVEEEAFTISKPETTFSSWVFQKRRHITTSRKYKTLHKLLLGLYYFSNFSFWLVVPLCFFFISWKWVLPIVIFRLLVQYIVVGKGIQKLKENNLLLFVPFLEMFLVWVQLYIFISNTKAKPNRWK